MARARRISRTITEEPDTFKIVENVLRQRVRELQDAITSNKARREAQAAAADPIPVADLAVPERYEESWERNVGCLKRFIAQL